MVSRGGGAVRSLLDRLRPPPRGTRGSPAMPPPVAAAAKGACFCSFGHSGAHGEGRRKGVLDLGAGRRFAPGSALSLKGCLDWQDGGRFRRADGGDGDAVEIRARVLAPHRQFVRDVEVQLSEEVGAKSVDGNGAYRRGKRLDFPEQAVPTKMVVAVDVDEVLGSFLAALNRFIAERYSWNHSVSEYHVYEFFRIWNCSREKANLLVHEFFTTHYFQDGVHPIPGARDALQNLSSFCSLSVVTSRQDVIKNHTLEWIEKFYPGLFEQIHFGNHFALEGQSRPKSEICRSFGAQVLIDDNPRYALECAEDGMRVLLFDYDNTYPWCKTGVDQSHPLVTKVHNWQEVEQKLLSWVAPES
ncbi:hypothetical protein CFC21_107973 [Triticum aestivum]|uniref:Tac7077 n=4 Tax=Triticinae TaxID=1648030 RepID=A0A453R071_AEGTS|nr:uncharacterized protein LOC109781849 [Aegilops tauschii subsp. strangulata]XP_020196036.1 uncharacterized protein LOC109781849 [Aegilops tauschii subsp. strangulata]XP_044439188.1 uncharacterized protein LOC123165582 [Triticum aestivum]KAF7107332.1 hypothetical protein CFC21_107973 [Triticum aestivum]